MNKLSFDFYFKWLKKCAILLSLGVNLFIIFYCIYYFNSFELFSANSISSLIVLSLFILFTSIYDFLLFKSKDVRYNNEYLIVKEKNETNRKIQLIHVKSVDRIFFFFYSISFINKAEKIEKIHFLISPNPSFTTPVKIKLFNKIRNETST